MKFKLPPKSTEITQPQTLIDAIDSAPEKDINLYLRVELVAMCHKLGYQESDTRGQSVKRLREMITSVPENLAASYATSNFVQTNAPAVRKPTGFKLPRRIA